MRKINLVLSTLILAALVLAACGGGATSTNVAGSPPPVTADATEDMSATESPTEGTATEPGVSAETPGVPVTGDFNPARITNQLDLNVWSQDGEQIGDVEDMVLNLDDPRVLYVVVGTGGFLDLGDREILVPWQSLDLQSGTGDTTGGEQNAFVLQGDAEIFRNAPDFNLGALPEMGVEALDWDADIRTYWESGGTIGGVAETPATEPATEAPMEATATAEPTATVDPGQGGQAADLQGVVLASEVLGSTITVTGQGNEGQGQATAPAAGTDQTATPGTDATQATATPGADQGNQGLGNVDATIEDMIVDVESGAIWYLVVNALFDEGGRWIPVPLNLVQWNAGSSVFVLNSNPAALRDAPFFENGQFPDTMASGWNSEFDTYWQNASTP
jgi:sporulation protein YlmC with PRC-barrel domain